MGQAGPGSHGPAPAAALAQELDERLALRAVGTMLDLTPALSDHPPMADRWSTVEIRVAVDAYVEMLRAELAGHKYNKAQVNRDLREGPLRDRSRGSIEMRMCNISAVLDMQGVRYISGYKPRKNVGAEVIKSIEMALEEVPGLPLESISQVGISDLPSEIPRECFLRAMARIDEFGHSPFKPSTTFDVIHEGRRYPPLAVVGFSLEELTGKTCPPGLLVGGLGTDAFRLLSSAGLVPAHKAAAATADDIVLDERVDRLHTDGAVDRPPEGQVKPERVPMGESFRIARDPGVKLWVLQQAGGTCEACGGQTFATGVEWNPWFLEVHHVVPLRDGGADTIWNAVALCPNCHRRCHHGEDATQFVERLYGSVPRLRREA